MIVKAPSAAAEKCDPENPLAAQEGDVTARQYDETAFQAALDFIRSREVDRVAGYVRRGRNYMALSSDGFDCSMDSGPPRGCLRHSSIRRRAINDDLEAELSLLPMSGAGNV